MKIERVNDVQLKITQEHSYLINKADLEMRKAEAELRIKEAQAELKEIEDQLAMLKGEGDGKTL